MNTLVPPVAPGWPERLRGARVLLFAPHPDDESLGGGGFIQHALQAGARLDIVSLTDGDTNPWPQRVLERRLRIGAADRRHWGERRHAEMRAALSCLGAGDARLHRLGWPDMGVTAHLQTDSRAAIEALRRLWRDAAPDLVVVPSLTDAHPDHSACHVLVRLVMSLENGCDACLTYHVHGRRPHDGQPVAFHLDEPMRAAKYRAIEAHRTQVALARRRLLAHAGSREVLHELHVAADRSSLARGDELALPWQPPRGLWPWLELMLAHRAGVHHWRWTRAPLAWREGRAWIALPDGAADGPVFAKLKLRCRSPWIFDHWGWHDLTAAPAPHQAFPLQY